MLLKHSFLYLFARGLPGVINLLAMALYTRLLSPDDYGNYALVIAGVGLANMTLFQWLRLGVLRFLPSYQEKQTTFLSTILFGYITLVVVTGFFGTITLIFISDSVLRGLILFGLMLLWAQAFFELNLELARIQLVPRRYGLLSIVKTTVALAIGGSLAYLGFGAFGLLLGLIIGMLLSLSIQIGDWKYVRFRFIETKVFHELLVYGLPLSATFILGFVVSSSDRFLLGWFLGAGATGMYAAGYDITKQTLGILMVIVNLAAYPLAIRALEQNGKEAARQQLSHNITLLLTIALPCTAGFALLAPNIALVFLGKAFRDTAVTLIPWIALGSLLAGIKAYYFDLSFQLGRHTIGQVWVAMAAAIANVILNLLWIPRFGLIGAAYATVTAYALGLFLSYALGRSIFKLPLPVRDAAKIAVATLGMSLALVPVVSLRGIWILAGQVTWGAVVFGILLLLFDVGGIRLVISKLLKSIQVFWCNQVAGLKQK
jgi:O-antigen/teichoic acid export membrane protein